MENPAFDQVINRKGTDCSKWDAIPYNVDYGDIIPMWVADMDFACPQAVIEPMLKRLEHPVFGYLQFPKNYYSAILNWHKTQYDTDLTKSDIIPVASVLGGVSMAIQALTIPGDSILIHTPGYLAFYNAAVNNDRKLISCPLIQKETSYQIDFELMEQQLREENIKALLLCSPHNPTGRIWTTEELAKMVELCLKHHVYIISDEIHADMTLGHSFTTTLSSHPNATEVVVALYSPTKTFNIAGLCTAYAVIPNAKISESFQHAVFASGLKVKNTLGISALIGGYENGADWVSRLNCYLLENSEYAVAYCNNNIRGFRAYVPQATYFLWIDCTETGLSGDEIIRKCVEEAHVAIYDGKNFINGGERFLRMNIACPRSLLTEALERLEQVF